MDVLRQTDLKQLFETSSEWCMSLYMPTHRTGRQQQQDPIRFRNMVVEANYKLIEKGLRQPDAENFLKPLEKYSSDRDFWNHQSDGLAIFLAPGMLRIYRLPSTFGEELHVASHFHIKPLIPLLSDNEKFYILALSLNRIQLFLSNWESSDEVELGDLPTNLKTALNLDAPKNFLGYHTSASSSGRPGLRRAVYHGHGEKPDSRKTDILRFFQQFDRGLNRLLDEKSLPMVLAGVDYLLPIYHQANTYPRLINEGLKGNPETEDANTLRQLAWEIVAPIFKTEQSQALERLTQMLGAQSEQAISGLEPVLIATSSGKVEILFTPSGIDRWGKFNPAEGRAFIDTKSGPENEELLNLAVMNTVLNAGKVFVVDPDKLPAGEPVAILRFSS